MTRRCCSIVEEPQHSRRRSRTAESPGVISKGSTRLTNRTWRGQAKRWPLHSSLREEWKQPETRQLYRQRSQGERLINEMVRRGARNAMAWGLSSAQLQAYVVVMNNNLSLLAKALTDDDPADIFDAAA